MSNLMKKLTIGGSSYEVCDAVARETLESTRETLESTRETLESKASYADMNAAVKKAAPRNLLDNSDFRNPVNQRGVTQASALDIEYFIDRWIGYGAGASFDISSKQMVITNDGSATCGLVQRISANALTPGKTYTLAMAATVSGNGWYLAYGANSSGNVASSNVLDSDIKKVHILTFVLPASTDGVFNFRIRSSALAGTATIEWAALYEGEYTETTLPEYQPKGYGAELRECKRYLRKISPSKIAPYAAHVTGGAVRLAMNLCTADLRTTPTAILGDDTSVIVRLGTGGYSEYTGSEGVAPTSIVGCYYNGEIVTLYLEFGGTIATNNMAVIASIATGYIVLSAEL